MISSDELRDACRHVVQGQETDKNQICRKSLLTRWNFEQEGRRTGHRGGETLEGSLARRKEHGETSGRGHAKDFPKDANVMPFEGKGLTKVENLVRRRRFNLSKSSCSMRQRR